MRFDKGNCRKKRVFSQPDVPTLVAVGVKYTLYFRFMTELCKYKTNFKLDQKPQFLQTSVGGSCNYILNKKRLLIINRFSVKLHKV